MAFRRSGVRIPVAPPAPGIRRPPHPSPNGGGCAIREARPTVTVTRSGDRTRIERYDPTAIEPAWQAALGRARAATRPTSPTTSRPKFYLLTMYPYPSGDLHIGHWYIVTPDRRARPVPPDARRERLLPDRLRRLRPAGRERRDQERHPPARLDDAATSSNDAPAVPDAWARRSTGRTRSSPASPTYYRWNQWLFLQLPRGGPRLPPDVAGRLVPQRRDAGPRAGRGRRSPLLALRRAGREARPGAVVPADHEVRGRAARLHRHRLAGADPDHADELDRPVAKAPRSCSPTAPDEHQRRRRRAARVHHPARHAVRRHVHGPRARSTRWSRS